MRWSPPSPGGGPPCPLQATRVDAQPAPGSEGHAGVGGRDAGSTEVVSGRGKNLLLNTLLTGCGLRPSRPSGFAAPVFHPPRVPRFNNLQMGHSEAAACRSAPQSLKGQGGAGFRGEMGTVVVTAQGEQQVRWAWNTRETETPRDTERDTDERQTERDSNTERHTESHRETEKHKERQKDTERHRERHRDRAAERDRPPDTALSSPLPLPSPPGFPR